MKTRGSLEVTVSPQLLYREWRAKGRCASVLLGMLLHVRVGKSR